MLNFTLFKRSVKSSYKLLLIFVGVLTLYFCVIAGMYDPDDLDILNQLASLKLSPELLSAMGFTLIDTSLLGFLSSYFYGLLMLAFPMVFYIILANKLIAGHVDKGSMAYILATPNTRKKVAVTQATMLLSSITLLVLFVTLLGIVYCQAAFPGMLDVKNFLLLNFGVLLTHFAISGICFFSSCLFNESRLSLLLGSGLPIAFLLVQMLSNSGEKLEILKYFTVFTLFNPIDIIHGENFAIPFIILTVIGVALYGAGIVIFDKKDLPL